MDAKEAVKERIRRDVIERLDMSREQSDEEIGRVIDERILAAEGEGGLTLGDRLSLRRELFNTLRRMDVLTALLEDPEVTEIMVNGTDAIFCEKHGHIRKTELRFESESRLFTVIQQIVAGCNRRVSHADPIVDARLPDGSRVNVVLDPVSIDGTALTIRKFAAEGMRMEMLADFGAFDRELIPMFSALVRGGYNILITGGTGAGKTTLLGALANLIPKDERIITIEDSAELRIDGIENLVRLETRDAADDEGRSITVRDLIKASLRMRPDRIIVGEVRDAAAADMLQALNTGHDGSLSTLHANSARDAMDRLSTMVLTAMDIPIVAVRKQIASAVDLVIHVGRCRDRSRKILEICEVEGMNDGEIALRTLFEFKASDDTGGRVHGKLRRMRDLLHIEKLEQAGLLHEYREGVIGSSEV